MTWPSFVLPGGDAIDVDARNKHKVFGFGPDVTLPVASKSKLFALVNIRYLWETGARAENRRPDAGRHGDLPGAERQGST